MARLLLLTSGNTFSHIIDCLAAGKELEERYDHTVHYGVSGAYREHCVREKVRHTVIPELWERERVRFPHLSWFVDEGHIEACVRREIALIDALQPDCVIADFKHTSYLSARVTGCRLITKNILSMLPATEPVFGFLPGDRDGERTRQEHNLRFFNRFACTALNRVAARLGVRGCDALSGFLDSDEVLIPDIPHFHLQGTLPAHYQVVALPEGRYGLSAAADLPFKHPSDGMDCRPALFLALGSDCRAPRALIHLVRALSKGHWRLLVSTSGNNGDLLDELRRMAPTAQVAPYFQFTPEFAASIDACLCQGGLGGIYQALRYALPLFIVPLHPEQDHNGRLVEFHGLGRRLGPSRAFPGQSDFYARDLIATPEADLRTTVEYFFEERASCHAPLNAWQAAVRDHSTHRMTLAKAVDLLLQEEAVCLS